MLQLKGYTLDYPTIIQKGDASGNHMVANEIISHAELLLACGDLEEVDNHCYAATGRSNFEQFIKI